jgi:hypothetical protein
MAGGERDGHLDEGQTGVVGERPERVGGVDFRAFAALLAS